VHYNIKMKALILHDTIPETAPQDQKDGLVQAATVADALRRLGYDPMAVPFSLDVLSFVDTVRSTRPAFVFNLVESVGGSGRLIHMAPAVMDQLGIPFTGATTDTLYLTSNKVIAKRVMALAGLPTPEWYSVEGLEGIQLPHSGPYIIKSVWEHASIGMAEDSVLSTKDGTALLKRMNGKAHRFGGEWFAERFVEGREFNLSLLASNGPPDLLPAAEMVFRHYPADKAKMVCYRAKWEEASFEYRHTSRSFDLGMDDVPLLEELGGLAMACWDLFSPRAYARVDFRVDGEGRPWILEVNVNPCLSPDAGFTAAAKRAGLGMEAVIRRIIRHSGCPEPDLDSDLN
jgi:D-alanine-D-alanine ligase